MRKINLQLHSLNHIVGKNWKLATVDKLMVFFALIVTMGLSLKGDIDTNLPTKECLSTPFSAAECRKTGLC